MRLVAAGVFYTALLLSSLVAPVLPAHGQPGPQAGGIGPGSPLSAPPGLRLRRLVLVQRHGVRSPLSSQIPSSAVLDKTWPQWQGAPGALTAHGAAGMRLLGITERRLLAQAGLLPASGCPPHGSIRLVANSSERTIASEAALADGLAPGCDLSPSHRPEGVPDPLFDAMVADPARFDIGALLPRILSQSGTPDAHLDSQSAALSRLEDIAGCPGVGSLCATPPGPSRLRPTPGGHGLVLSGPLYQASGVAEALMLAYLEGLPMNKVGWGRATEADLSRLSALHGAMLAATSRPPAIAGPLTQDLRHALLADLRAPFAAGQPLLSLYVGHDDTIEPLLGLLGIDLHAPGYAAGEVPIGGALVFAEFADATGAHRLVRLMFLSQPPHQLRTLDAASPPELTALDSSACHDGGCPLADLSISLGG